MKTKLILATGNQGKIKELNALLGFLSCELPTLSDLDIQADVPETGRTYKENAALKAQAYASLSRLPALSDDSGLEVMALGGAPGIYSARYSPLPNATDADRRQYLLEKLFDHPRPWIARFRCVVAVAFPGGDVIYGEGVCPGEIIPEERGQKGFGYDPIFLLPIGQTMAELDMEVKNRHSHRALAIRDLESLLKTHFHV